MRNRHIKLKVVQIPSQGGVVEVGPKTGGIIRIMNNHYISLNTFIIKSHCAFLLYGGGCSQRDVRMAVKAYSFLVNVTHKELEQELLDSKHLEQYPAAFEEMPYNVCQITNSCIHLRQLYDNVVDRKRQARKHMSDLQQLKPKLTSKSLPSNAGGTDGKSAQYPYLSHSQAQLFGTILEIALFKGDESQGKEFRSRMRELEKEIDDQVVQNVSSFCFLKEQAESAGETYKYSGNPEHKMWDIAESKFEDALLMTRKALIAKNRGRESGLNDFVLKTSLQQIRKNANPPRTRAGIRRLQAPCQLA